MVEDNFDGNICRCTGKTHMHKASVGHWTAALFKHWNLFSPLKGYRSILDAMKTFAGKDSDAIDIEVSLFPHPLSLSLSCWFACSLSCYQ